ncbi:MAG: tetratricopeptide repeat protein [Desulfuromonadaceae bacterium]
MTPERTLCAVLLLLCILISGCAGFEKSTPRFITSPEKRSLESGLRELHAGNEQAAHSLLEKVVDGVPTVGVTDEALFRLALLSLKEEGGKGLQRAQASLERLTESYPDSIWTRQSSQLRVHLAEFKALRNRQRELKVLKEQNLSLSRDNKEMRQSLEQLKQLDMELEKRIKR